MRDGAVGEGSRAYAWEKARACHELATHFEKLWDGLRGRASINAQEIDALRTALDEEGAAEDAEDTGGQAAGEEEDEDEDEDEDAKEEEVGFGGGG